MKSVRRIIDEEMNKSEVRGMITDKLTSFIGSKEFTDKVNELIASAVENFYRSMYNKRGFWKSFLK